MKEEPSKEEGPFSIEGIDTAGFMARVETELEAMNASEDTLTSELREAMRRALKYFEQQGKIKKYRT